MSTKAKTLAYQELVQAIIKAVPEVRSTSWNKPHKEIPLFQQFNAETGTLDRPITLEDVLRALPKPIDFGGCQCGADNKDFQLIDVLHRWNLGKPLSEQSPETIEFLHSLLCRL